MQLLPILTSFSLVFVLKPEPLRYKNSSNLSSFGQISSTTVVKQSRAVKLKPPICEKSSILCMEHILVLVDISGIILAPEKKNKYENIYHFKQNP